MPSNVSNCLTVRAEPEVLVQIRSLLIRPLTEEERAQRADPDGAGEVLDFNLLVRMPEALDGSYLRSAFTDLQMLICRLERIEPNLALRWNENPDLPDGARPLIAKLGTQIYHLLALPWVPERLEGAGYKADERSILKYAIADEGFAQAQRMLDNLEQFGAPTWYEWRVMNWGTKWNAYDVVLEGDDEEIKMRFDSAWSPPDQWFQTLLDSLQTKGWSASFSGAFHCEGHCAAGFYGNEGVEYVACDGGADQQRAYEQVYGQPMDEEEEPAEDDGGCLSQDAEGTPHA